MNNTLIIYPHDPSTTFLLEAFHLLQKHLKNATFFEIQPNEDSHNQCIAQIDKHECIIFMGHGSHLKLSSSIGEGFSKEHLVSFKDFEKFNNKYWLLFSCNSNDLIKKSSQYIFGGIGFGNLPTDFNDISGVREFDSQAYLNVNEKVIEEFRKSIVWIIVESIYALLDENLNFRELYNRMTLLIDRKMIDSLENIAGNDSKEVANLLYEMKQESEFYKAL